MARVGIIFGLLLCGLTVVALVGSLGKSPAQFIPMMVGIPILFCGVVSLNPHRRKHAMHTASAIALLGALAGGGRVGYIFLQMADSEDVNRAAMKSMAAMSVLCTLFAIICVISFVQARRRKTQGNGESPVDSSSGPESTAAPATADATHREIA